jgi:hypothetical protein
LLTYFSVKINGFRTSWCSRIYKSLRAQDLFNLEGGHTFGHACTLRKSSRTHIGVGSITSLVANDEAVLIFFKVLSGNSEINRQPFGKS